VRFPGIPTWFSASPGHIAGGAPLLGEHTGEVLDEIGTGSMGKELTGKV